MLWRATLFLLCFFKPGAGLTDVRIKPRDVEPVQFDMGNLMQDSATLKRKIDEVDLDIDGTL